MYVETPTVFFRGAFQLQFQVPSRPRFGGSIPKRGKGVGQFQLATEMVSAWVSVSVSVRFRLLLGPGGGQFQFRFLFLFRLTKCC